MENNISDLLASLRAELESASAHLAELQQAVASLEARLASLDAPAAAEDAAPAPAAEEAVAAEAPLEGRAARGPEAGGPSAFADGGVSPEDELPTGEPQPAAEPAPIAEPEPAVEPDPEIGPVSIDLEPLPGDFDAEPTVDPFIVAEPAPVAEPASEPDPFASPEPEAAPAAAESWETAPLEGRAARGPEAGGPSASADGGVSPEDELPTREQIPAAAPVSAAAAKAAAPGAAYSWATDLPGSQVKNVISAVSLNDRVLFINTLFREDPLLFQHTISVFNSMDNFGQAVEYVQTTFPDWDLSSEVVYRLMMAVRRRLIK